MYHNEELDELKCVQRSPALIQLVLRKPTEINMTSGDRFLVFDSFVSGRFSSYWLLILIFTGRSIVAKKTPTVRGSS